MSKIFNYAKNLYCRYDVRGELLVIQEVKYKINMPPTNETYKRIIRKIESIEKSKFKRTIPKLNE